MAEVMMSAPGGRAFYHASPAARVPLPPAAQGPGGRSLGHAQRSEHTVRLAMTIQGQTKAPSPPPLCVGRLVSTAMATYEAGCTGYHTQSDTKSARKTKVSHCDGQCHMGALKC